MPPETTSDADTARDAGKGQGDLDGGSGSLSYPWAVAVGSPPGEEPQTRRGGMMLRRRHPEGDRGPVHPSEPGITETLGPEMTVVGRGAQVEGTLVSAESIRIDGQAKGKIAARCDVILSSHSHVEADIRAQNVVSGGTLKGNITAGTRTELIQGGRVEGTIRSKVLVVREGALFSGQASIDLEDALGEADGSAFPEDELRTGYEESVRRAAEWYRSSLYGPKAEPGHNGAQKPDAAGMSEPDETMRIGATEAVPSPG
jgi:cytoskeletal protein CcmA (bactofilin family)